jgi:hypothetical protein
MKAIKFVILAAGLIGVISFFLPYVHLTVDGKTASYSALKMLTGKNPAEEQFKKAKDAIEQDAVERAKDDATADQLRGYSKNIEKAFDLVKGVLVVAFAPAVLFLIIAGVGIARGKLDRIGGAGVMVLGLIGAGVNALFLAAWASDTVKREGGGAEIGQYLLLTTCAIGFVCGLLTVIKPDRGGRFG